MAEFIRCDFCSTERSKEGTYGEMLKDWVIVKHIAGEKTSPPPGMIIFGDKTEYNEFVVCCWACVEGLAKFHISTAGVNQ